MLQHPMVRMRKLFTKEEIDRVGDWPGELDDELAEVLRRSIVDRGGVGEAMFGNAEIAWRGPSCGPRPESPGPKHDWLED